MNVRKDDSGSSIYFRSDRFFCVSDKWYFSTREGAVMGPYQAKQEAENNVKSFLALHMVDAAQHLQASS